MNYVAWSRFILSCKSFYQYIQCTCEYVGEVVRLYEIIRILEVFV